MPVKTDPHVAEGKPELSKIFQDLTGAIDSSGICLFTSFALGAEDYAELLKGGTGWDMTGDEVMRIGERVWNLEKLYNIREGWTPKDDELPKRLTGEPIPKGPSQGKVSLVPAMLPIYYEKRGWDANGQPKKEKLEELGL